MSDSFSSPPSTGGKILEHSAATLSSRFALPDETVLTSVDDMVSAVMDSEETVIRRCGNLACQNDSFLRESSTSVLQAFAMICAGKSSKPMTDGPKKINSNTETSSKKKNAPPPSISSSSQEDAMKMDRVMYKLILDDSIFFPEGGGQPADIGILVIQGAIQQDDSMSSLNEPDAMSINSEALNLPTDEAARIDTDSNLYLMVEDVQNVQGFCVLTCRPTSTPTVKNGQSSSLSYIQVTNALIYAQIKKLSIIQRIDWNRRFDHMTQHSAQHLLSAVAYAEPFHLHTHSWSFGRDSACYIDFAIDPSIELSTLIQSIKQVESFANEHIRSNLPMVPRWIGPDLESNVRSRLLPSDLTGPIRIVEIGTHGAIDCNTCCGTHVPSLGHLQVVKLTRIERFKANILRVSFVAGPRIIGFVDDCLDRQNRITVLLSCSVTDQVQRVEQMIDERRIREKEMKALQEKIATFQAEVIYQQCQTSNAVVVYEVESNSDMNSMLRLSENVLGKFAAAKGVLLLLFSASGPGKDDGAFLLAGESLLVDKCSKDLTVIFSGRGGGKNGRFQGKGGTIRSRLNDAFLLMQNVKVACSSV